MLSFKGVTYRVSKVCPGTYEVVRIIDDCRLGTFETVPRLRVIADGEPGDLVRELAYLAIKQGKLSTAKRALGF
jgi:hypothetical protein